MSNMLDKRVFAFLSVDRVETRRRFVISFGQIGGERRRVSAHRNYLDAVVALDRWSLGGIPIHNECLERAIDRAPWLAAASTRPK